MSSMLRRVWVVGLGIVWLTLASASVTRAEPSRACRDLAKQFAETPEKLAAEGLFRLQACIGAELRNSGFGERDAPPPKVPLMPGGTPPLRSR